MNFGGERWSGKLKNSQLQQSILIHFQLQRPIQHSMGSEAKLLVITLEWKNLIVAFPLSDFITFHNQCKCWFINFDSQRGGVIQSKKKLFSSVPPVFDSTSLGCKLAEVGKKLRSDDCHLSSPPTRHSTKPRIASTSDKRRRSGWQQVAFAWQFVGSWFRTALIFMASIVEQSKQAEAWVVDYNREKVGVALATLFESLRVASSWFFTHFDLLFLEVLQTVIV